MVIDAFGLTAEELRSQFPAVYQWLYDRVKPERDQNNRARLREQWWTFAEPRKTLRAALRNIDRYIATVETSKHRTFQFLPTTTLPEHKLIAIALDDAFHLGVLSSQLHVTWALATGGTLEDRPVYSKSTCFDTFPFPAEDTGLTPALRQKISTLAEQIDQHRKRVLGLLPSHASSPDQATTPVRVLPGADFWAFDSMRPPAIPEPAHPEPVNLSVQSSNQALAHTQKAQAASNPIAAAIPASTPLALTGTVATTKPAKDLTLTGLYNVLQALREGRALTSKEKQIHSVGLVGVLNTLHDELDAAVLAAYGWGDLAQLALSGDAAFTRPTYSATSQASSTPPRDFKDELLQRLVALNQRRTLEEAAGLVRWLRPAFQNPLAKTELPAQVQQALEVDFTSKLATPAATTQTWPSTLPEQVKAVAQVLTSSPAALTQAQIEACFSASGSLKKSLPTLLQTLAALGRAQASESDGTTVWRA